MARVEAALDEYREPGLSSVMQELERSLIERPQKQWAGLENAALHTLDEGLHLVERPYRGHHRLIVSIEGGRAGDLFTASLLAKPIGCTAIKLEMHDAGVKRYGASTFDLEHGEESAVNGSAEQPIIRPASNGYLQVSLSLRLTVDSAVHLTLSLLDRDNAVIHAGNPKRGIGLRDLDVRR
jgi:hypothetical protein